MGQRAELQVLLVATAAFPRPEILQPVVGHREVQQSPHRVGQGELLQNCRGKNVVVHDRRTPEGTQRDSRWGLMISGSYPPRNAETLNSLPSSAARARRTVPA